MSLSEVNVIDKVEVLENGCVQVRQATRILRDGTQISEAFTRWVIHPGEDYSTQDDKVKAICSVIHTPELIAEFEAKNADQQAVFDSKGANQ